MCPGGVGKLGQPNACRFHRMINNLTEDGCCPNHDFICPVEQCNFHCGLDNLPKKNLCPSHSLLLVSNPNPRPSLVEATDPLDQMTVTIKDESHFDNPDLIFQGDNIVTKQDADHNDLEDLKDHLEKKNKQKGVEALAKGKIKDFQPLTETDNHGFVPIPRKELSQAERNAFKAKIRADIAKFKALEHK